MLCIAGWWRHLKLRLTGKQLILTGGCRQCGACCRRLQLQQGKKWLRSKRQFRQLVKDHPEFGRFEPYARDSHGLLVFDCRQLGPDNRCLDYDNRPQLCRDFPHKGIFFCGGQLPPRCGYAVSEGLPFEHHLRKSQQKNDPAP